MKIQWNKVTWYSKTIALVFFVALPFIGFYYGTQYGKMLAPISHPNPIGSTPIIANNSNATLPAYYTNTAQWQVDNNNTSGGFSIAYPLGINNQDNYSVAPSTDWLASNANSLPGIKYFSLTVPSIFEPQTNLIDITFTIGGSKNDTAITQCLTMNASGGPVTVTSSAMINGIPFTIFHSSDVGAGNYYETTSYRTLHAGECYAIEYTIHSGAIGNYPSSYGLQPFNENNIILFMQNILGTFKFN